MENHGKKNGCAHYHNGFDKSLCIGGNGGFAVFQAALVRGFGVHFGEHCRHWSDDRRFGFPHKRDKEWRRR